MAAGNPRDNLPAPDEKRNRSWHLLVCVPLLFATLFFSIKTIGMVPVDMDTVAHSNIWGAIQGMAGPIGGLVIFWPGG